MTNIKRPARIIPTCPLGCYSWNPLIILLVVWSTSSPSCGHKAPSYDIATLCIALLGRVKSLHGNTALKQHHGIQQLAAVKVSCQPLGCQVTRSRCELLWRLMWRLTPTLTQISEGESFQIGARIQREAHRSAWVASRRQDHLTSQFFPCQGDENVLILHLHIPLHNLLQKLPFFHVSASPFLFLFGKTENSVFLHFSVRATHTNTTVYLCEQL